MYKLIPCMIISLVALILSSCQNADLKANYPKSSRDEQDERFGKITGPEGITFGDKRKKSAAVGITVNSFLWRAGLEAASNLPILIVDPFSGVITTDWYQISPTAHEKFKVNIIISSDVLRADAVKVSVFKQVHRNKTWIDEGISETMSRDIEDRILTRARQLKIASD